MNWLRAKAKRLSLLALFALALQLGLSFGHVHNDLGIGTASASVGHPQASSDNRQDQDLHRDFCAICASVAMTGNAVTATVPSLPLPLTFASLETTHHHDSIAPETRRGAFRSRAPPRSSLE